MAKQIVLEKIPVDFGSSFTIRKFDKSDDSDRPRWHSHPELELVYVREGSGKRHIGQHISQYDDGDLILVGPNLPHYGFTDRFAQNKFEIVLHFRKDCFGPHFFESAELVHINRLLEASINGLTFYGNVKEEIGERLESMFYMTPFEKSLEVLKVLNILANCKESVLLNAHENLILTRSPQTDRLDSIFSFVRQHFTREIQLEEMAELIHMTVPSFCRFFKTHTNKTFISFVQQYRITHACKLLVESDMSIIDVCFECGFNNFSHFSKTFKKMVGKSPSEYRKEALLTIAH